MFIYGFISCFDDHVNYAPPHSSQISVPVYISSLTYYISCVTSVTQKFKDESTSEIPRDGFFFLFAWHLEKPFRNYCIQKTKMSRHLEYYLWYTLANSPISFWNRLNPTFTMAGHFFWYPTSAIGTTKRKKNPSLGISEVDLFLNFCVTLVTHLI